MKIGMNQRVGITSFTLKVIAIVGMTCNHAAWIFSGQLSFPLLCALEGAGGVTFPIMAFLIAEGWRHTSNIRKYELRLAVFALVSQVPFTLFLGSTLNVMFTLLIGLVLLDLRDSLTSRAVWWVAVVAGIGISWFCDWQILGVPMILIAGLMPTEKERALYPVLLPMLGIGLPALVGVVTGDASMLPNLLYALGNGIAGLFLCCYNGKRGRPMKWFFYGYYPAHIALLGAAHLALGL